MMHNSSLVRGLFFGILTLATFGCGVDISVEGGGNQTPPTSPPTSPPTTPRCQDSELHVVGIYDPYNSATNAQGPATVHIDRPGRVKLFLSSYTATQWTVTAGPGTQLVAIAAHAYEPVTVTGPAGVPVEIVDVAQNGQFLGCGYEYPDKDPTSGCETPQLLTAIEQHVGQPVNSFHGCYAASDFVIDANLGSSSNCATQMGYAHTSMVADVCKP